MNTDYCEYGCGEISKYQLKSGKFCCSKTWHGCSVNRLKNSEGLKRVYKNGERKPAKCVYNDLSDKIKNKMAWSRGQNVSTDSRVKGATKEEVFCENSTIHNGVVKNWLIRESGYVHECQFCKLKEWMDPINNVLAPIKLELDHINGIRGDNRRENLRLICLNCHSFTPNFRGKNDKRKRVNKKVVQDDVLIEHLKTKTMRQTLIAVGMAPYGANYERLKKLKFNV